MARRRRGGLDRGDACNILQRAHVPAGKDFFTLSTTEVGSLLDEADRVGYRKPKNANGSRGRYFHAYLQRLCR